MKYDNLLKRAGLFLKLSQVIEDEEDEWDPKHFPQRTDEYGVIRYQDQLGRYHRLDGPARHDKERDLREYYYQDQHHRKDGPAVINGPLRYYYRDNENHRVSGPSTEDIRDDKNNEWWIRGWQLNPERVELQKQRIEQVKQLIKNPMIRDLMDQALKEGNEWWNVPAGQAPAREVLQDLLLERGVINEVRKSPRGDNFKDLVSVRDIVEIYEELKDHRVI